MRRGCPSALLSQGFGWRLIVGMCGSSRLRVLKQAGPFTGGRKLNQEKNLISEEGVWLDLGRSWVGVNAWTGWEERSLPAA